MNGSMKREGTYAGYGTGYSVLYAQICMDARPSALSPYMSTKPQRDAAGVCLSWCTFHSSAEPSRWSPRDKKHMHELAIRVKLHH